MHRRNLSTWTRAAWSGIVLPLLTAGESLPDPLPDAADEVPRQTRPGANVSSAEPLFRLLPEGTHWLHRGERSLSGFSWNSTGARGFSIPLEGTVSGRVHPSGLVGTLALEEPDAEGVLNEDQPVLERFLATRIKGASGLALRLSRAEGAAVHQAMFIVLPGELTVFIERFTAQRPLTLIGASSGLAAFTLPEDGVPAHGPGGETPLVAEGLAPLDLAGMWLNLGDSWGFIVIGSAGFRITPSDRSSEHDASGQERLLFPLPPPRLEFDQHEVMFQRVLVVAPGQPRQATRQMARRLAREGTLQTARVFFELEGWLISGDFDEELPHLQLERIEE